MRDRDISILRDLLMERPKKILRRFPHPREGRIGDPIISYVNGYYYFCIKVDEGWQAIPIGDLDGNLSIQKELSADTYKGKKINEIRYANEFRSIQEAIDDLPESGGTVYIPPGTYIVKDSTIRGVSNLKLIGEGYSSVLKMVKSSTTSRNLLRFENVDNIEISHLRLWGDSETINIAGYGSEHDHAINLTDTTNVKIHHCWIEEMCGDGIYINNSANAGEIIITDNHITNPNRDLTSSIGRNSIAVVRGKNIIISNNVLNYGYPAVIDLETNSNDDYNISNISITNNLIKGGEAYGINVLANQATTGKTSLITDINISGNVIKDCSKNGIIIWRGQTAGTATVKRVKIIHNTLVNCDDGTDTNRTSMIEANSVSKIDIINNTLIAGVSTRIGIYVRGSGTDTKHIQIKDNQIHNTTAHGIHFYATSGNEITESQIVGNHIFNASYGSAGTAYGIKTEYTDKSLITQNYVSDDQATPTQLEALFMDNCDDIRLGPVYADAYDTHVLRFTNVSGLRLLNAIKIGTFYHPNLAANQSLTAMQLNGAAAGYVKVPNAGMVIAISANGTGSVTGGTVTIRLDKNGIGQSGHQLTITSTEGDENYKFFGDTPNIVAAGDKLRLLITSTADYIPDGTISWWADVWFVPY